MNNKNLLELLKEQIPNDHSHQISSEYYIGYILKQKKLDSLRVLDLGCGTGKSLDKFKQLSSNIEWFGLDIENSPEVNQRKSSNASFYSFDGIHIPFDDNYFDLIYSNQVFEHVRYPNQLLKEVNRVLKNTGYFFGSTSHLEPYHSFSFWNYTPYGFKELLAESNFQVLEIRPSIDSLTLIIRRTLGCPGFFDFWWKHESPFNYLITIVSKLTRRSNQFTNIIKLLFCGQFCFLATKTLE